jgi:hypothetical protein
MNARDDTLDFPLSKCDNLEANAVRFEFYFQKFSNFFRPISCRQYQSENVWHVGWFEICLLNQLHTA